MAEQAHVESAETQHPKGTKFKMRAQLLDQGRTDNILAAGGHMEARIKVYASGGENALHTHPNEDHTFVILNGAARYYDENGDYQDVGKNEGILLPAGAYYWFQAIGEEPLVLLRLGCRINEGNPLARLNINGDPFPGKSPENKPRPLVVRPGEYFE